MTDEPLRAALDRIKTEGLDVTAAQSADRPLTVRAEGTKTLGAGWSASAAWQWAKDRGHAWIAGLRWRPRTR